MLDNMGQYNHHNYKESLIHFLVHPETVQEEAEMRNEKNRLVGTD